MDVLDLLKHGANRHLYIVGIGIVRPGSPLQVIMVLDLDWIVLVIIGAVAADDVLMHIIKALIGYLGSAVEDECDKRHCHDKHRQHELHALAVADHAPVPGDEVLLLDPLDIVLDIIPLYRHEILIKLEGLQVRQFLAIVCQDIHMDEEVVSDTEAYLV